MRLLLLGGTGQVGEEFRALRRPGDIDIVAPGRSELDLNDAGAITATLAQGPWSVVINAAAYTEVDRAESAEAAAFTVNAGAPRVLAAETARREIPLLHISTDYVFDGRKKLAHIETDAVNPLNVYGRSSSRALPSPAATRDTLLCAHHGSIAATGKTSSKPSCALPASAKSWTIVDDQRGCPTAASDIAAACLAIAQRCAAEPANAPYGTYHFAGKGEATWFEFAKAIVEIASPRLARVPLVVPIKTADYPTPATRPADTRLNCDAITRCFGIAPRPWPAALAETMNQLLTG